MKVYVTKGLKSDISATCLLAAPFCEDFAKCVFFLIRNNIQFSFSLFFFIGLANERLVFRRNIRCKVTNCVCRRDQKLARCQCGCEVGEIVRVEGSGYCVRLLEDDTAAGGRSKLHVASAH